MYERAGRILHRSWAIAVAVSVVHYVDNYVNYRDYPAPAPGSDVPVPSQAAVGLSWFVFTAFGVLALVLWHRRRIVGAAVALTVYSVSGLVGLAHYAVPAATDMAWWRQGHVVLDIACGLVLFGFALWATARAGELRSVREPARSGSR
ncbi:hypothetical protein HNR19_004330 [Nocardioides thalensis]|uniref:Uncharacterized protein n=1 Tax=Nocardioides thalensis TaxID=1914755 RepID=A0A853CAG2_9ACTN|nr:hypothetical protein [Nocardioides thalensis]NYJ03632.1 hypothetical protein [Nocardioides thalensis]